MIPCPSELSVLCSYHYYRTVPIVELARAFPIKLHIFVDSGGFSAMTSGVRIPLAEYAKWLWKNAEVIAQYANLDAIGDPVRTARNQEVLEAEGLTPMPVFHHGSDMKFLDAILERYDRLALGGMVPLMSNQRPELRRWVTEVFQRIGTRKVAVHGFGVGAWDVIKRFPWASVDSATLAYADKMANSFSFDERKGMQQHHTLRTAMRRAGHVRTLYGYSLRDVQRDMGLRTLIAFQEFLRMEQAKRARAAPDFRYYFALNRSDIAQLGAFIKEMPA